MPLVPLRLVRGRTDRSEMHDEDGFSLIELMTVILIIGVLALLALPTFLGARTRAFDRATQSDVRNAFAAEKAYYTDNLTYTTNPATMTAIEAAITYLAGDTPLATDVVYLDWDPLPNTVYVSAMSDSGTCWYLREIDGGGSEFASDPTCGIADAQVYGNSW
jgi:type IV pilus assembly protein PilA